jgi:haloacid dehalogenase superfamily, subfamily IA, variant 3 with third motif having DD or ED/haloacid dehalogenase superfamily, subfamily IA, variant 1 with third motif having Dx(3-4)D or Dx(3-4)E
MILLIRAVLFDLDGTVVNTNDLIIVSYQYTLKKLLGICPDESSIVKSFGEPLMVTMEKYSTEKAEELFKTYKEYNALIHDDMVKGIDGVIDAIKGLKEMGIKVGIATSKMRDLARKELGMFGLLNLMDVIITLEDTQKHKPCGDPVLKALEILNISPEDTIYVGDSHMDVLCGKDANCRTCIVKYSAVPLNFLLQYNPDYIIDKPGDIINLVASENEEAV